MTDPENQQPASSLIPTPEEIAGTTATVTRPSPKTTAELLKEIAKTGNPLSWCLMKLWEPHYEFDTKYVPEGADPGPVLQKPLIYGLKKYRVKDLHLDTGEHVTAWYKAAQKGYPTVVYCHGNAGALDARAGILQELTDRGFGVVIAAYPGFKGHKERPRIEPSEATCNATGHAMVRYLINEKHIPMKKIVLFGESLGGAVALRTALNIEEGIQTPARSYDPQKAPPVVCFNTFTSLVKRAKEQFPMLPASILMRNRFESDAIIDQIKAPILLLHGLNDEFTPYHHTVDLAAASHGKAKYKLFPGVTHSATYPESTVKDPEQIRRVINFTHHYLHELGMCPPSPMPLQDPPEAMKSPNGQPEGNGKWQNIVTPSPNGQNRTCPDSL